MGTETADVRNRGARLLRLVSTVAACGLLLLLTACVSRPTPPPPVEWIDYVIGAPDRLLVTILPEPTITEEVTVRPDGMVTIQLIGDVPAGGRTTTEVAQDIQKLIGRYKRGAVVTVSLIAAQSDLISVFGEVGNPQSIQLTRQMRVTDALGEAGDVTFLANTDGIRVVRSLGGSAEVIHVDMDAIRGGDLSTNIQLYGGDIVYVPPTVMGHVGYFLRQILFPFDPLLGVARAAGGAALVR